MVGGVTNAKAGNDLSRALENMEGEGCLPPAKQAKLSRYGFQAVGNASTSSVLQTPREHRSTLNEDGDATVSDSGTRDQETDALESPEPDGSRSSAESSTESANELGKS